MTLVSCVCNLHGDSISNSLLSSQIRNSLVETVWWVRRLPPDIGSFKFTVGLTILSVVCERFVLPWSTLTTGSTDLQTLVILSELNTHRYPHKIHASRVVVHFPTVLLDESVPKIRIASDTYMKFDLVKSSLSPCIPLHTFQTSGHTHIEKH